MKKGAGKKILIGDPELQKNFLSCIKISSSLELKRRKSMKWCRLPADDNHCYMDVYYNDNGLVTLHLKVYYLQFLVPLVENVVLDPENKITCPKERVITV